MSKRQYTGASIGTRSAPYLVRERSAAVADSTTTSVSCCFKFPPTSDPLNHVSFCPAPYRSPPVWRAPLQLFWRRRGARTLVVRKAPRAKRASSVHATSAPTTSRQTTPTPEASSHIVPFPSHRIPYHQSYRIPSVPVRIPYHPFMNLFSVIACVCERVYQIPIANIAQSRKRSFPVLPFFPPLAILMYKNPSSIPPRLPKTRLTSSHCTIA